MTVPPRVDHDLARLAAVTLDAIRDPETREVGEQEITRLKGLPALLRTSGPLPALAFFAAKATDGTTLGRAYAVVGNALSEQVSKELGCSADHANLNKFLLDLTAEEVKPDDLSRVTARLEAFTGWLRRLAEAAEHEQRRAKGRASGAAARDGAREADGHTGEDTVGQEPSADGDTDA